MKAATKKAVTTKVTAEKKKIDSMKMKCSNDIIINGAVNWASENLGFKCRGVKSASTLVLGALTAFSSLYVMF